MKERSGSAHWRLVPDPDNSGRMLWEWDMAGADDMDALFDRVAQRTATALDHEQFCACIMDRFTRAVYAGELIEPWILQTVANRFTEVLAGGEWCDAFPLPGRPTTPIRPWRDQRDLEIYCSVANAVRAGSAVTAAIVSAAADATVSFESARNAYYKWKKQLSKNAPDV